MIQSHILINASDGYLCTYLLNLTHDKTKRILMAIRCIYFSSFFFYNFFRFIRLRQFFVNQMIEINIENLFHFNGKSGCLSIHYNTLLLFFSSEYKFLIPSNSQNVCLCAA